MPCQIKPANKINIKIISSFRRTFNIQLSLSGQIITNEFDQIINLISYRVEDKLLLTTRLL